MVEHVPAGFGHSSLGWPFQPGSSADCSPCCRDGRRVSWEAVAAELGTGRTAGDCQGKWQRMMLRLAEDEDADGGAQQSGEESAEESRQRQEKQDYRVWPETEADTAAQLLGAVGARLAADSRFALTARSLPAKLEVAVSMRALWYRTHVLECGLGM